MASFLCRLFSPEMSSMCDFAIRSRFAKKAISSALASPFSGVALSFTFSSSFSQPTISLRADLGTTFTDNKKIALLTEHVFYDGNSV